MTTPPIVLALAATALAAAADASVLCRTPTRAVVERTACKARETAIPLVDVGPSGPAGEPGPAGAPGRGGASIVDAAGVVAGPLFHLDRRRALQSHDVLATALVDHPAIGGPAALAITRDGRGAGTVYYADAACAGTPHVVVAKLLPELQVVEDAVFLPVTPAATILARSYETASPFAPCGMEAKTSRGGCCLPIQQTIPAGTLAVAAETTLGELGLRAPFAARLD
jgi:hypothetical protein